MKKEKLLGILRNRIVILFVFFFFLRVLATRNHSSLRFADEWYQTVEFAQWIVHGSMGFFQEVALHLRNLFWPALLSIPVFVAEKLKPDSVYLKTLFVQCFMVILDLGIVWSWLQLTRKFVSENKIDPRFIFLSCVPLMVAWFTVVSASSPSAEHGAAIFTWLCLAALSQQWFFLGGVLSICVWMVKYPAGLLSVGIFTGILLNAISGQKVPKRDLQRAVLGMVCGVGLSGLIDWMVYGRPWESVWMFLQYNVFTGAGARVFGDQDWTVYIEYFWGHWPAPFMFIWIIFAPAVVLGVLRGLRNLEAASFGILFYGVGHLLIRHKEGRFMEPIEWLLIWYGLTEWALWYSHFFSGNIARYFNLRLGKRGLAFVCGFILICNFGLLLRSFWAETWTAQQTYFELDSLLERGPLPCGVVSVRRPLSIQLPNLKIHSLGYFPMRRRGEDFKDALQTRPLAWIEHAPSCSPGDTLLLHLHRPAAELAQMGCEILPSGVLRWIPRESWHAFIERRWVSGTWYRCPSQLLSEFKKTEIRTILVSQFKHLDSLPPLGTNSDFLLGLVNGQYPSHRDAVMPDLQ